MISDKHLWNIEKTGRKAIPVDTVHKAELSVEPQIEKIPEDKCDADDADHIEHLLLERSELLELEMRDVLVDVFLFFGHL